VRHHNEVIGGQWIPHSSYTYNTTTIFCLRRLSCVEIFPKAVVHTKNDTCDEALTRQILFQGNEEPS